MCRSSLSPAGRPLWPARPGAGRPHAGTNLPVPADGGDDTAALNLGETELATLEAMKTRLTSDPDVDPPTGAELGERKA